MKQVDAFLERLGIRYPIIQAPMAGTSTVDLAAAVSNAGGLGSLGVGASPTEVIRAMLEAMRSKTVYPVNVNVFCHQKPDRSPSDETAWIRFLAPLFERLGESAPASLAEIYPSFMDGRETLDVLLERPPTVVSFHFGLPPVDWIDALRSVGIYTLATATNPREAAEIEQAGVDAIVAQGFEAGGHRGVFDPSMLDEELSTAVLVRCLVKQSRLPIIAAGGIMDGSGIRAMLELGAAAAQLGTAFVPCPESSASDAYRTMLKSGRVASTWMTSVISGRPARGISNELMRFAQRAEAPEIPPYPIAYDVAKQLACFASKRGNAEFSAFWAGQGAPLVREMPAAELITTLVSEMGAVSKLG